MSALMKCSSGKPNAAVLPVPVRARPTRSRRTVRSALDALFDHGRPARVQLLVLIDRGHRELPIEARYTGRMVQTSNSEIIEVKFQEIDGQEKVMLVERVDDPDASAVSQP